MNVTMVKLGPLTRQVTRLADAQERVAHALEALLLHQFGIRSAPITDAESAKDDAEVSYASDERSAAIELEDELVRFGYKPPPEGK